MAWDTIRRGFFQKCIFAINISARIGRILCVNPLAGVV